MELSCLKHELRNFLDPQERLVKYPSKNKPKILSLFYLAAKFDPEVQYTEREINAALNRWHTFGDPCMLRRDLYDRGFFRREKDGSRYWMADPQPTPATFGWESENGSE